MTRKTKVRIVGDPTLCSKVCSVLAGHFVFEKKPDTFSRAVGRDYSHTDAPGCTIYITIKKPKKGF